ncbi:hypothetical protein ABZY09_37420 [Streptomyces sp. NPDC002928]|uniref:hypothetical protein n=1 Tax=Streptomyces sp. NPDC002928 TaxID=3154440 RepID=UPI0033A7EAA6
MKRAAVSFVFAAAGMTIASLITRHALPPLVEVVAFLVVAFVATGVLTLARAGWRRARS